MIRLFLVASLLSGAVCAEGKLSASYPATLEFTPKGEDRIGYRCMTGPEDVWSLRSFTFEIKDKFKLKLGPSTLVIGHADGNAIWAYIKPARGTKLKTKYSGDGEKVRDVWLRFHPSRIDDLFPAKTIRGKGDPDALYWALRTYNAKAGSLWSTRGLPAVPPKDALVIDMDMVEGKRRVYSIEMKRGKVTYKGDYVGRSVPTSDAVKRRQVVDMLESAWDWMDRKYALFGESPAVDWQALREPSLASAKQAKSIFEVGILIHKMFEQLNDDDLWVFSKQDGFVENRQSWQKYNANQAGLEKVLGKVEHTPAGDMAWSLTPHDVGYLSFFRFGDDDGDETTIEKFDEILDQLAKSWVLIIDLRFAFDGNRETCEQIVGRFISEDHIYGRSQTRVAGGHDSFGEVEELAVKSRGPWTYEAPLYVITGAGTDRYGQELLQMLSSSRKIITMGSLTSGRMEDLEGFDLDGDMRIFLTTSRRLDEDGKPLTPTRLEPTILCEFEDEEFTDENDPVLFRVLEEVLKTPANERVVANAELVEESEDGGDSEVDEELESKKQ